MKQDSAQAYNVPDYTLTVEERVLLHLYKFVNIGEVYDFPQDLTQEGISKYIGVHRKHLPRTLRKLMQNEQIEEKSAHIVGLKQKRKVYLLTWKGKITASKLKEQVDSWKVTVVLLDGSKIDMHVVDIPKNSKSLGLEGELTLFDVIRLVEKGVFDCALVKKKIESEKRALFVKEMEESSNEKKMMIYETIMEKAWMDGSLTSSEQIMVEELRKMLGISNEDHKKIEQKIVERHADVKVNRIDIYKNILETAWADGIITPDESAMLNRLKELLGITDEQHRDVEKDIWKGKIRTKENTK